MCPAVRLPSRGWLESCQPGDPPPLQLRAVPQVSADLHALRPRQSLLRSGLRRPGAPGSHPRCGAPLPAERAWPTTQRDPTEAFPHSASACRRRNRNASGFPTESRSRTSGLTSEAIHARSRRGRAPLRLLWRVLRGLLPAEAATTARATRLGKEDEARVTIPREAVMATPHKLRPSHHRL